ncbi:hypothetical protein ACNR90_004739 [Candidozyma auris]
MAQKLKSGNFGTPQQPSLDWWILNVMQFRRFRFWGSQFYFKSTIDLYEYGSQGFSGVDKGDLPQGEGRRSDYQAIRMHIPGVKGVSISIAYTPMWIEARNYHKSPLRDDSEV